MLNIRDLDRCIAEDPDSLGGPLHAFAEAARARIDDARNRVRAIAALDEPLTMGRYALAQDAALDAVAVCAAWQRIDINMPRDRYTRITEKLAQANLVRTEILDDIRLMRKCVAQVIG